MDAGELSGSWMRSMRANFDFPDICGHFRTFPVFRLPVETAPVVADAVHAGDFLVSRTYADISRVPVGCGYCAGGCGCGPRGRFFDFPDIYGHFRSFPVSRLPVGTAPVVADAVHAGDFLISRTCPDISGHFPCPGGLWVLRRWSRLAIAGMCLRWLHGAPVGAGLSGMLGRVRLGWLVELWYICSVDLARGSSEQ